MIKFEWPTKILWLVLLSISLIACASAGSDQVNGQVTPGQQAEVTQESIAQSTTESPEETQAVRTALEATDPASVELASGEIQFVEFFAFWCSTCRSMAPVVHGLEAKYEGQINFVYLDIDDDANNSFKQKLGYRVQPHFFLLDEKGEIIEQWLGRVTSEDLETAFGKALK